MTQRYRVFTCRGNEEGKVAALRTYWEAGAMRLHAAPEAGKKGSPPG